MQIWRGLLWTKSRRESLGSILEARNEVHSSTVSYEVEKQDDLWKWTVKTCVGDVDTLAHLKK